MAQVLSNVRTFESARAFLSGRDARKIAHNTRLVRRDDGRLAIIFHDTTIVVYGETGETELFAGDWRTRTTKDRINLFCPEGFVVWQNRGNWILCNYADGRKEYPFANGITILPGGGVVNAGTESGQTENRRLARRILAYATKYAAAMCAGDVPAPDSGDCFYCQMREVNSEIPLGEFNHDTSHLESHLDESYFVPSLFYRAAELYPVCSLASDAMYHLWVKKDAAASLSDWQKDILARDVKASLTKYIKKQFGIAR